MSTLSNIKAALSAAGIADLPESIREAQQLVRFVASAPLDAPNWRTVIAQAHAADDPQIIADAALRAASLEAARTHLHIAGVEAGRQLDTTISQAVPEVWASITDHLLADLQTLVETGAKVRTLDWDDAGREGYSDALRRFLAASSRVRVFLGLWGHLDAPGGPQQVPGRPGRNLLTLAPIVNADRALPPLRVDAITHQHLDETAADTEVRTAAGRLSEAAIESTDRALLLLARGVDGFTVSLATGASDIAERRERLAGLLATETVWPAQTSRRSAV